MNGQETFFRQAAFFETDFAEEIGFKQQVLELIDMHGKESFSRDTFQPGHFTASAFIINKEQTKTLLVHHAKYNIWVQPGGHIEPGEFPLQGSIREAREETGLANFTWEDAIFDMDVHLIPASKTLPAHFHHDIRYLFVADENSPLQISDESNDMQWILLMQVERYNPSRSVMRMVEKVLKS